MILFLDTTDLNTTTFVLIDEHGSGRPIAKTVTIPHHESHTTLKHLDSFLKKNKKLLRPSLNQGLSTTPYPLLTTIIFCAGPGSFTGIRVGASIAQALAFAWNITLKTIKKDKLPKNLQELTKLKSQKKLTIDYGRPAV